MSMKGKHTEHAKLLVPVFICAMFGGTMVPAFYKDPKENHTSYAYTWVYSPKDQEVGLWAEFQNYSRSEMDLAPLQGKWDYKGSRIWINDKEIMPPCVDSYSPGKK